MKKMLGILGWSLLSEPAPLRYLPYVFVFIAFALLVFNYYAEAVPPYKLLEKEIPEHIKMSIDLLGNRSEIMATWAMAIMASLGFIFNYVREHHRLSPCSVWVAFFSFVLAFVSIFLSHIHFDVVFRMLVVGENPIDNPTVFDLVRGQFATLVVAMIVFLLFVFRVAMGVESNNKG